MSSVCNFAALGYVYVHELSVYILRWIIIM